VNLLLPATAATPPLGYLSDELGKTRLRRPRGYGEVPHEEKLEMETVDGT